MGMCEPTLADGQSFFFGKDSNLSTYSNEKSGVGSFMTSTTGLNNLGEQ